RLGACGARPEEAGTAGRGSRTCPAGHCSACRLFSGAGHGVAANQSRREPLLAPTQRPRSSGHWPRANPRGRLWLMTGTLTKITALVAFVLTSGTVKADRETKTAAQLAVEQFNDCAHSLFTDDFAPAEIDYELSLNKKYILFLFAKWSSSDSTLTILTRI